MEESICVEASLAGEYTVSCEFAGEDEKVQNLIGAMFEGTFISGVEKAYTNLDYQEAYHLTFYDKHNLPLELNVYEEGYVVKSDLGKDLTFVLQVDAQACKEFIEYINEACNEKVIENTF